MHALNYRAQVLRSLGATDSETDELLAYNQNLFEHPEERLPETFPLPDEAFVEAWQSYVSEAEEKGVFPCLKQRLVQLRFPIEDGISQCEWYRDATLRGKPVSDIPQATGLPLKRPGGLKLVLHTSPAGRIPLLIADAREDFVSLVQALASRNEPKPVPESMGACIVSGLNNWDRIRALREAWERQHPDDANGAGWSREFRRIIPQKDLYQDRFLILSTGPYSSVSSEDMDLPGEEWVRLSRVIRREHECSHYFTRRVFSSMKNRLLDEIIADYMGITAAAGRFRADWCLRFLGLENYPEYRQGGRLENYRGDPPLSNGALRVLRALVQKAAENLERFDMTQRELLQTLHGRALVLMALTFLTLEELASREALSLLQHALRKVAPGSGG
ncbi:hypothetical protein D3OALGB2SA_2512 [Olavius algarvensis associated proteobacterium Delta 3]|nr:hypothetical protein D3OALGB2SA_2512 [Olavius algarvensis associated proteobacterium Delta 3]